MAFADLQSGTAAFLENLIDEYKMRLTNWDIAEMAWGTREAIRESDNNWINLEA